MNVLIVEDHPISANLYELIINQHFVCNTSGRIEKAFTCEQAYNAVVSPTEKTTGYDLALLDYNLPAHATQNIYNGYDIAKLVRKQHNGCKIIMITAHSEALLVYDILRKAKPEGFIIKNDITAEGLIEVVSTVLSGNYYRSGTVKNCTAQIWDNEILTDDDNRKILFLLAKGYKVKDLHKEVNLSASTIQKRIINMKKAFGISENGSLLLELTKRGYL